MGSLSVLDDGTIRYSDGEKPAIELARTAWPGNIVQVRTKINGWLSANKLTGWTVTVTSIGIPPGISVTTNSTRSS